MKKTNKPILNNFSGQAMIMMVIMMGGMMLSATAVAGLLMFYQLRQANEASASGMAVFAADAGLEAGSYCYFYGDVIPLGELPQPGRGYCDSESPLSNGARYKTFLIFSFDGAGKITGFVQDSYGFSGKTERALQNTFSNRL